MVIFTRFSDHINVIFGEEVASWDIEKKYTPENIEVISMCPFINFSFHSSICLLIHPFIYLFIHLFTYSSIHLPIHPSVYLFIHLFTYSSICLIIHSSIHLPIHPFIYLFIHLFNYSSIHP